MTHNDQEEQILSRLVLDEGETRKKLNEVVSLAEQLFKIDGSSRTIILSDSARKNLGDKDRICVFLIARYFGAKMIRQGDHTLFTTEWVGANEIASLLGKKITSISGRLTELVREGVIEKSASSQYRIFHYMVEPFLLKLKKKMTGGAKEW